MSHTERAEVARIKQKLLANGPRRDDDDAWHHHPDLHVPQHLPAAVDGVVTLDPNTTYDRAHPDTYEAKLPGKIRSVAIDAAAWPFGEPKDVVMPGDSTGTPWILPIGKDIKPVTVRIASNGEAGWVAFCGSSTVTWKPASGIVGVEGDWPSGLYGAVRAKLGACPLQDRSYTWNGVALELVGPAKSPLCDPSGMGGHEALMAATLAVHAVSFEPSAKGWTVVAGDARVTAVAESAGAWATGGLSKAVQAWPGHAWESIRREIRRLGVPAADGPTLSYTWNGSALVAAASGEVAAVSFEPSVEVTFKPRAGGDWYVSTPEVDTVALMFLGQVSKTWKTIYGFDIEKALGPGSLAAILAKRKDLGDSREPRTYMWDGAKLV